MTASENGYPGLRCGKTTTLTIDDSVLNIDNKGKEITPKLGVIPEDVTLSNGTSLKKGDRLTLMDSENPGSLIVYASYNAAAIGGGGGEDGGTMTFNGGNINAHGTTRNAYADSGAGIGGGLRGDGGNITINGGIIQAQGSYHAAGVGGGFGYNSPATPSITPSVIDPELHRGQSGNITINGGYTESNGGAHGNGFGEGCSVVKNNAEDYKIIVTGGTVLAKSGGGNSSKDLGGSCADVYVLGGSLKATTFTSHGGNQAYGDMDKNTKVFMTKISLASWGLDKVGTTLVDDMDMKIAGVNYKYGMPSYTDPEGYLYFWLPNSSDVAGQEISVDLNITDKQTGERLKRIHSLLQKRAQIVL